jgi:hypothetical protein
MKKTDDQFNDSGDSDFLNQLTFEPLTKNNWNKFLHLLTLLSKNSPTLRYYI